MMTTRPRYITRACGPRARPGLKPGLLTADDDGRPAGRAGSDGEGVQTPLLTADDVSRPTDNQTGRAGGTKP